MTLPNSNPPVDDGVARQDDLAADPGVVRQPLRVLLVEDNEDDAALILRLLRRSGYEPDWQRVQTAETLDAALADRHWDVVLSDYAMPHFDGLRALRTLRDQNTFLPFIIISGSIGEETAVAAMRAGASDYLMKSNLTRLVPAIERELRESAERQERARTKKALLELQDKFQVVFSEYLDVMLVLDAFNGDILHVNHAVTTTMGLRRTHADRPVFRDVLARGPARDGWGGARPGEKRGFGFFTRAGSCGSTVRSARWTCRPTGCRGADGGHHRDVARRDRTPSGAAAAFRRKGTTRHDVAFHRGGGGDHGRVWMHRPAQRRGRGVDRLDAGGGGGTPVRGGASIAVRPWRQALPRGCHGGAPQRRGGGAFQKRHVAIPPRSGMRGGPHRCADPPARGWTHRRPRDGVPGHDQRAEAGGGTPEGLEVRERGRAGWRHRTRFQQYPHRHPRSHLAGQDEPVARAAGDRQHRKSVPVRHGLDPAAPDLCEGHPTETAGRVPARGRARGGGFRAAWFEPALLFRSPRGSRAGGAGPQPVPSGDQQSGHQRRPGFGGGWDFARGSAQRERRPRRPHRGVGTRAVCAAHHPRHGTGIAPEHLARIFDPYFTTKSAGSGLGLATAYSIIKKHDGTIQVESEIGAGPRSTSICRRRR